MSTRMQKELARVDKFLAKAHAAEDSHDIQYFEGMLYGLEKGFKIGRCPYYKDLLDALVTCADYLAEFYEEGREHHVIKHADKVIAKAKGKTK